ncbi:hypothetical protein [Jiangella aurantiaca]|uniref:hypothetical protein n=1 Tax=Jiangella aurantiaca TaxID=2530373 RepID=UPI0013A5D1F9|nr:hypothetical protein [Jiangella aurantiaca]
MNSTYVAQLVHEERAGRLRAEADADRLARTARRAARRQSGRRSGWLVRHLPSRHAA